jgi:hypothetical protein
LQLAARRREPLCDRVDELLELSADIRQFHPLQLGAQLYVVALPIHLGMELTRELLDELRRDEIPFERVDVHGLELRPPDALPVRACALSTRPAAGEVVFPAAPDHRRKCRACQTGEQVSGMPLFPEFLLARRFDAQPFPDPLQPHLALQRISFLATKGASGCSKLLLQS